ncbi:tRNA lysidine(34) synthetase TilS [Thalassospira marina]|uniref:tRNA(Ile)-lysidine synthase n=2 Tax=Thalassospira marina TaxID=2048283 RepID=A0A2N3KSB1_9PROT|nr:tRNA lysidine(34) synthetase TilS [Thalassospira marina]
MITCCRISRDHQRLFWTGRVRKRKTAIANSVIGKNMTSRQNGSTASSGVPLDAASFSALMAPFAPFEARPRLLVAVSGGADSMALAILAKRWCDDAGGELLAVTVDHGLRADAADEARWVTGQLAKYGIEHVVLSWDGPKPGAAVQEMARAARYRLMDELAHKRGILHLLVAHHFNDQAETITMRQNHDSGVIGQAGMSARRNLAHCRLLRPLLTTSRCDIEATLMAQTGTKGEAGQAWINDPSNTNPTFERVRTRQKLQDAASRQRERFLADAGALAAARIVMERAIGRFLARHVSLDPDGVARIDGMFASAHPQAALIGGEDLSGAAAAYGVGHVLRVVGGAKYPPARDSVLHALQLLREKRVNRHSLGGCVLHRRENYILVYREFGRMALEACPVNIGSARRWDERFELCLEAPENGGLAGQAGELSIIPLGLCDPFHKRVFRNMMAQTVPFWAKRPRQALAALPLLQWQDQPLSVAGLEIHELSDVLSAAGCPTDHLELFRAIRVTWRFVPSAPLWEGGFKFVANP